LKSFTGKLAILAFVSITFFTSNLLQIVVANDKFPTLCIGDFRHVHTSAQSLSKDACLEEMRFSLIASHRSSI